MVRLTSSVMSTETLRQRRHTMGQPEIRSSKDGAISLEQAQSANAILRRGRADNHLTITSTLTSYSFVYFNATRAVTVATTSVLCLPSGFVVC